MSPEDDDPLKAIVTRKRRGSRSRKKAAGGLSGMIKDVVQSPRVRQIAAALAGLYVVVSGYNWYLDATIYQYVKLGGTENDALYALGPNPQRFALASGGERLDFPTNQGTIVSVVISPEDRVQSVRCAIAPRMAGACPAMFRIAPGDTETDLYAWLGLPNRTSVNGDVLTAEYTGIGMRVELRQFKVVAVTHFSEGDTLSNIGRFIRHLVYLPGGVI